MSRHHLQQSPPPQVLAKVQPGLGLALDTRRGVLCPRSSSFKVAAGRLRPKPSTGFCAPPAAAGSRGHSCASCHLASLGQHLGGRASRVASVWVTVCHSLAPDKSGLLAPVARACTARQVVTSTTERGRTRLINLPGAPKPKCKPDLDPGCCAWQPFLATACLVSPLLRKVHLQGGSGLKSAGGPHPLGTAAVQHPKTPRVERLGRAHWLHKAGHHPGPSLPAPGECSKSRGVGRAEGQGRKACPLSPSLSATPARLRLPLLPAIAGQVLPIFQSPA